MKRILTTILMAVGITCPYLTHLGAQELRAEAKIPFAFVANTRTFPAGAYQVSRMSSIGGDSLIFALTDGRNHSIFVPFNTTERGNPEKPSLTFACYGKECVLAKITPPGSDRAYALSKSDVEKHLHHSLRMASLISIKIPAR